MVAILQIMSVDWPRTSNSDADKCIIILKSVQHHESLHECKVAISKATLHFRKVTKDFKQKRVDDGNEKVKQQRVGLTTKNDNFARANSNLTARLRREQLVPMRVLRRTLTGTDDNFFIPFFNLAVDRNSTTPRKVTYGSHIKGDDVNRDEV